ncbi:MAG: TetR/AcrR family transcriptional regulator [Anaerolineaceae bacterium]|nr:TetR/AcrR family transcriptional regulator [Anaerolineaceae bacterium]
MPYPTFFNLTQEKRQKILDTAIEEFAENDYENASISKIVETAGISKGSIYQYFTDKRDLYLYLLELVSTKKAEMMADANVRKPESNVFDYLRWLFREMSAFDVQHPRLAKIGYRAAYGKSPLPDHVVARSKIATRQYFEDLIENGKTNGEVRPDVDASMAAFMFTAVLAELGKYILERTGIDAVNIVDRGSFPIESPKALELFDQLVLMLQQGMANERL